MAIKVNYENINRDYGFRTVCAFVDTTGSFFLVDGENQKIVLLDYEGCTVFNTEYYDSINDFLNTEFDCEVAKVYTQGNQYEIIVNG